MDNIDIINFPVDLEICSHQVRMLWPLVPEYQQQVRELWAATADDPGPREIRRRGYAYLVTLYYEIRKRAYADNKPASMEFDDMIYLCRYVGPRPTAKHSLHRMDNNRGYCVDNVEWADKRKQAEVRRSTQHHLYLGRRLTDRQLAELLSDKGYKMTASAIKKFRQRQKHLGVAPSEITRLIFKKHGLPYESSEDPIEAWDFPIVFHEKLTSAYQGFRHKGEARIEYYIRWLTETANRCLKLLQDPLTTNYQKEKLAEAEFRYRALAKMVWGEWRTLHRQQVNKVIDELVPGWPSASLEMGFYTQPQLPPVKIASPISQPVLSTNQAVNLPSMEEIDEALMAGLAEGKSIAETVYECLGLALPKTSN